MGEAASLVGERVWAAKVSGKVTFTVLEALRVTIAIIDEVLSYNYHAFVKLAPVMVVEVS